MAKKCSTCGYEIHDEKLLRCPRCHGVVMKYSSCNDCKGCSIMGCSFSREKTVK